MKKYLIILFLFIGITNIFSQEVYKLDSVNFFNTNVKCVNLNTWLGWQKVPDNFTITVDKNKKVISLYTNKTTNYFSKRLTEEHFIDNTIISGFFTTENKDVFINIYTYNNGNKYMEISYLYDGYVIKYSLK